MVVLPFPVKIFSLSPICEKGHWSHNVSWVLKQWWFILNCALVRSRQRPLKKYKLICFPFMTIINEPRWSSVFCWLVEKLSKTIFCASPCLNSYRPFCSNGFTKSGILFKLHKCTTEQTRRTEWCKWTFTETVVCPPFSVSTSVFVLPACMRSNYRVWVVLTEDLKTNWIKVTTVSKGDCGECWRCEVKTAPLWEMRQELVLRFETEETFRPDG